MLFNENNYEVCKYKTWNILGCFHYILNAPRSLSLSQWYPGSGVVLDCIDSRFVHPYFKLECEAFSSLYASYNDVMSLSASI